MTCGPRATELGALLLGLKFRKLLKLDAWCLALVACGLQLVAWRLDLGPVAMFHGPRFMIRVDGRFSVSHKSRWRCLETSSFYSSGTYHLGQARGTSCSSLRLY